MKEKILAAMKEAVENGDTAGVNLLVVHNGREPHIANMVSGILKMGFQLNAIL